MSPAFPSRRRAEQFDQLLEGALAASPSDELAELLAFAEQVRALPEASPREEFVAGLRSRLMAEAPAALAIAEPDPDAAQRLTVSRPAGTPRRERRLAVAVAAFSVVGATTASAVASQGALPGDTLYPVKRLLEDTHTALSMGEDAKADTLLAQAGNRLQEARELGRRGDRADTAAIGEALRDFSAQAKRASGLVLDAYADDHDTARVDELRRFTADGITTLDELSALLPQTVHGALAGAVRTLVAIDAAAAQVCPACDTSGITELPTSLVGLISGTTQAVDQVISPVTGHGTRRPGAAASARPGAGAPSSGPSQRPAPTGTGATVHPGLPGAPQAPLPTAMPTSVGGAVGEVGGAVGGAVGDVGDAVTDLGDDIGGPVGGVVGGGGGTVSGAGDAVGSTTGGLGDTVDGVAGGLLGGLTGTRSPQPKP